MIQHIEKALEKASKKCNCSISDFIVSPVFEEKEKSIGHHLWIIEFTKIPKNIINLNEIFCAALISNSWKYNSYQMEDLAE